MRWIEVVLIIRHSWVAVCLAGTLAACDPGQPQTGAALSGGGAAGGQATPLSDAEFRALSSDQQYQVTNKLLSTLYKGVPVAEFYDVSEGMAGAARDSDSMLPSALRAALRTNLPDMERAALDRGIVGDPDAMDEQGNPAPIDPAFQLDDARPKQMPLARITAYPLSRDALSQWMAWHLANTILFSPAEEIDSADITDVQNLFRRLDLSMMGGRSIREMVATHQRSVENWRRFRSPEDNTREMMEIYLGIFDNDAEVPAASKACQDLYLTDERDGYKLAYTDFPNDEPQLVLDNYVLTCNEFYDVVAGHPLLIPRVVSVLVDYFFAGRDVEERLSIVDAISSSNPRTFEDVFLAILFSRTYLLDTERAKSFEESFLATAARMSWRTHPDTFKGMTAGRGGVARADMSEMGWPAMSQKLGRVSEIPLDSLSFANHHKALRESLLLDRYRWRQELGLVWPEAPTPAPVESLPAEATARDKAVHAAAVAVYEEAVAALPAAERTQYERELTVYEKQLALYRQVQDFTLPELFDYLFLSVVQRRANDVERRALTTIVNAEGYLDNEFGRAFVREGQMDDLAVIVFDYLSRLPETYYLTAVE